MEKITVTASFNVGFMSGASLEDLYRLCGRHDIEILKFEKIGGVLVKKYIVSLRGTRASLRKLNNYFNEL